MYRWKFLKTAGTLVAGSPLILGVLTRAALAEEAYICQFKHDGSNFKVIVEDHYFGKHPTVHTRNRFAVTNAYTTKNCTTRPDIEISLRWFDLKTRKEHNLLQMPTDGGGGGKPKTALDQKIGGSPHKLDPYPACNYDYTKMCLNGSSDGYRQVFVADLETVIG